MKNLLIFWIVFQLFVIGISYGTVRNEIEEETYDCETKMLFNNENYLTAHALVPLIIFVEKDLTSMHNNYCLTK
jgi:hypothetical protein